MRSQNFELNSVSKVTGSGDDFLTLSTFIHRFNITYACTLLGEFQFAYYNNKTQLKQEELTK